MRRSNPVDRSTTGERCDGCDRVIEPVYLAAGTSLDVHLHDDDASTDRYHFCGACGVDVVTLVDDHFGPDDDRNQLAESRPVCNFCTDPID